MKTFSSKKAYAPDSEKGKQRNPFFGEKATTPVYPKKSFEAVSPQKNSVVLATSPKIAKDDSFDLDKSIEEIQTLVSDLQNDNNIKNANIAKLSTAISVGKIIVKIHKNITNPFSRTETNNKIKEILGRERSTIQDYKRLTYFKDTTSLADLGVAGAAKVCGHLRNYNKITNNTFLNIEDILNQIDNERCKNKDSLLEFEEEISKKSSSMFCMDIIKKEAKEKFGEDFKLKKYHLKKITVSSAKKIISNLNDYDEEEFNEALSSVLINENDVDNHKIGLMFKRHIKTLRTYAQETVLTDKFNPVLDAFEKGIKEILEQYIFE